MNFNFKINKFYFGSQLTGNPDIKKIVKKNPLDILLISQYRVDEAPTQVLLKIYQL